MSDENARKHKLPLNVYNDIKTNKKFLYLLKHPPEQCRIYTLDEIPVFLKKIYGLNKFNQRAFLKHSNRITQKGRELAYSYLYGSLISKCFKKEDINNDVAVMVPEEDRGIDAYIRIVGKHILTALPLQICEVKSRSNETKKNIITGIYDVTKKAKAKSISELVNLLCVISSEKQARSTVGELRHEFGKDNVWEYDKILCMHIYSIGTLLYTVYIKNKEENHFMLNDFNGKFDMKAEGKLISF